jgi:hypothetical protein
MGKLPAQFYQLGPWHESYEIAEGELIFELDHQQLQLSTGMLRAKPR